MAPDTGSGDGRAVGRMGQLYISILLDLSAIITLIPFVGQAVGIGAAVIQLVWIAYMLGFDEPTAIIGTQAAAVAFEFLPVFNLVPVSTIAWSIEHA